MIDFSVSIGEIALAVIVLFPNGIVATWFMRARNFVAEKLGL